MSVVLAFADRVVPTGSFCWVSVLVTSGNICVHVCMHVYIYIYILTLFLRSWEKLRLYIWWRDAITHLSLFLPTHEECQPKCECYSWDSWKGCNTQSMAPARSHHGRGQGGNKHSMSVTWSVLFLFYTSTFVAVEFLALQGACWLWLEYAF